MSEHASAPEDQVERRTESRYIIELPALLVWGQERYEGTVRNLSPRGVFLSMERRAEELQQEDPVEIIFEELNLSREATIARVERRADEEEPVGIALILHETLDVRPFCDRYL